MNAKMNALISMFPGSEQQPESNMEAFPYLGAVALWWRHGETHKGTVTSLLLSPTLLALEQTQQALLLLLLGH